MAELDMLALYWTVSGPVEFGTGREWSQFGWPERCAEAARVGFKGLGLWHTDIEHQLETSTLAEMSKIFADAGLMYLEAEFLTDFFADRGGAGGIRPTPRVTVRHRIGFRRSPHQGGQPLRHTVRTRSAHRGIRRTVPGRGPSH
jgi:hypothetical protein